MQQTPKYKLNLIETSDTFSPAPLNENAQKTEAKFAALDTAATALDARVTALELHKIVVGKFHGTGYIRTSSQREIIEQTFQLGFDPVVVFVSRIDTFACCFAIDGFPMKSTGSSGFDTLEIVPGGFTVRDGYGSITVNGPVDYYYLAIG